MSNEYAFGPYRFFMITAYIAVAVASLAVTLGLKHVPAGQKLISAGRYFLFFWILGLLIASILPIFADLENQTLMAKIYQINAPAHILFFTIGAVLVSIGLRREESWQPIQGLLLGISVLMIILFVIVGITTATNAGFAGLGQRLFILSTMTWLILVAAKFRTAYAL
jgi:hypothetical protein